MAARQAETIGNQDGTGLIGDDRIRGRTAVYIRNGNKISSGTEVGNGLCRVSMQPYISITCRAS